MKNYVIGIDFGTLSGRAVLVEAATGKTLAEATHSYAHGVMDETLPSGRALPPDYALQHPSDYLDVLRVTVPAVLEQAGVAGEEVAGLGIDFTACTVMPVDAQGEPLCLDPAMADEPHAYVKLWKHHAAQGQADEINALAEARGEAWLSIYGGKISSEWMLPKLLQILREAPAVYEKIDRFTEAGDWLSRCLTGKETHSAPFAGYKALWNAENGYPSNDFMKALDSRLNGVVGSTIFPHVCGMGESAGFLNEQGAALTGLPVGTPLSLPMIDAHAAMPALGLVGEGDMMLIMGTSSCHILNAKTGKCVPGICGYVKDGVVPGCYTYEAGQAAVGDIFDWFVKNCLPAAYEREAEAQGIGLHKLLREKAKGLRPGESGLVALDWWNGNRSVLVDASLSGMLVGLTLRTRPEEIYRALIEATAFGTRMIVEQYEACGLPIGAVCAAGGIAQKDEMMMQIYADVLGRDVRVAGSSQAGALGSAIYAAVAGGIYPDLGAASAHMAQPDRCVYHPQADHVAAYDRLYATYQTLHDYFGRENPQLMKELRGE
ncbi:MAG: ribulokinase [Clostridia bacterium]|nr:ribulokinase [Clostridia bacterium]